MEPLLPDQANNLAVQGPGNIPPLNDGDIEVGLSNLRKGLGEVESGFQEVGDTIRRLNTEEYWPRNADGSQDTNFFIQRQEEWQGIKDKFQDLMWVSRERAVAGSVGVEQYRNVILPMMKENDTPLQEKKEVLQEFIRNILSPKRESAKEIAQKFSDISGDIESFSDRITSISNHETSPLIQELKRKIQLQRKYLESRIDRKDVACALGAGITVGLLVRFICGASTIAAGGAGLVAGVLVVGGIAFWKFYVKAPGQKVTEGTLNQAEATLKSRQNSNAIEKAGLLSDCTPDMCCRLGSLADAWCVVRTDAQKIEAKLEMAIGTNNPRMFIRHIESLDMESYEQLERVLDDYANHIYHGQTRPN